MNEKRQILLFKALKNGGTIDVRTANRLYSGNNGKDALISLEFQDYLEHAGFGNFKINEDKLDEMPQGVVEKYEAWQESKKEIDNESKYKKTAV